MAEYSALGGGDEGTGANATNKKRNLRPFSGPAPTTLSEPLNGSGGSTSDPGDPFYIFRGDLYKKLELVDEALAEFLRVIHQTVRYCWMGLRLFQAHV